MITQDAEIVFNKKLTLDTFLMGLRAPEVVAEARPGQFVMIKVRPGADPLLRRPFSICATIGDDLFLILYQVVGQGTRIISTTGEGQYLPVLGPLGKGFDLPEPGQEPVLVAGGIGIAPLIFLAQTIKPGSVVFMAGYRSADQMVDTEQVGLSGISLSIATDDGTAGHRGPVTDFLETHLDNATHDLLVYACGPFPMLKRVAELTLDRGISCQVSLEAQMACGLGACQGCAVKVSSEKNRVYHQVCQDGPVFPVHSLDWKSL
jgi:dihydroorotate dehydrogenase electron transfer subunit